MSGLLHSPSKLLLSHVPVTVKVQPVLFPESVLSAAVTAVTAFESFTSRNFRLVVPCALMFHCVGVALLRSDNRLLRSPFSVSTPVTVCVPPAGNVSVTGVIVVFVRLPNVLVPEIV